MNGCECVKITLNASNKTTFHISLESTREIINVDVGGGSKMG